MLLIDAQPTALILADGKVTGGRYFYSLAPVSVDGKGGARACSLALIEADRKGGERAQHQPSTAPYDTKHASLTLNARRSLRFIYGHTVQVYVWILNRVKTA